MFLVQNKFAYNVALTPAHHHPNSLNSKTLEPKSSDQLMREEISEVIYIIFFCFIDRKANALYFSYSEKNYEKMRKERTRSKSK